MYTVYVDDNYHYMDESERYTLGEFDTYQTALKAAKNLVDESLAHLYKKGMSERELYSAYHFFGEDPFISPDEGNPRFSAWDFAKERCPVICGKATSGGLLKKILQRWWGW